MKIRLTLLSDDVVQLVNGDIFWRITCFRYSQLKTQPITQKIKGRLLTRGDVVVRFDGDVMSNLHEVDSFQDG
jgi:hypothetical protein